MFLGQCSSVIYSFILYFSMLLYECNPSVCPAREKCCNQDFEKREYPPLTPFVTKGKGWGLKTLKALKPG